MPFLRYHDFPFAGLTIDIFCYRIFYETFNCVYIVVLEGALKLNGPRVADSWKVAFKYLTIAVFALESRHRHPHLLATPGKSVES